MTGKPLPSPELQAAEVIRRLKEEYPSARIALSFEDPWQLTVAVILSAQCTDKKVNEVTARLFKKYPSVLDYAEADPEVFSEDIKPTGFYRNKARHITAAARKVLEDFGGEVPRSMRELLTLPGVARKTANIILANAYPESFAADPDAGIAVDTHVHRLANRLGLAHTSDPARTELALMSIVPREQWACFPYLLIEHGRNVCTAKKPKCEACSLADICPSALIWATRS